MFELINGHVIRIYINNLQNINDNLLYSLNNKHNERERIICINCIDVQCKLIKPKNNEEKEHFVNLIKKYLEIQEKYKNNKINLLVVQLQIRNPNLTTEECHKIIVDGGCKNILCLYDVNGMYDYVSLRHKEIMKLEHSIQEVKELFIYNYALVKVQEEQVQNIAKSVDNAKENVQYTKKDLVTATKDKKMV